MQDVQEDQLTISNNKKFSQGQLDIKTHFEVKIMRTT